MVRIGNYFLSIIDFLEKASSTFCGFKYDINQMIIDKDLFFYLFEIIQYFRFSDFLLSKVFKIL